MTRIKAIGYIACLLILTACVNEETQTRYNRLSSVLKGYEVVVDGPSIYNLALVDGEGVAQDLTAYQGDVLVINLWATWCAPCIREMPDLNHLAKAVAGQGVQVLAVASGRQGAQTPEEFITTRALDALTLVKDHRMDLLQAAQKNGLPTTIIADKTGQIRGVLVGIAQWDAPEVIAVFQALAQDHPA